MHLGDRYVLDQLAHIDGRVVRGFVTGVDRRLTGRRDEITEEIDRDLIGRLNARAQNAEVFVRPAFGTQIVGYAFQVRGDRRQD